MSTQRNPIDAILDPNDDAPVTLYDDQDNPMDFEQICLVPIGRQIYCILKPLAEIKGIADDEALVFQIYTDKEREDSLILITDTKIIAEVFKVYGELFENSRKKAQ